MRRLLLIATLGTVLAAALLFFWPRSAAQPSLGALPRALQPSPGRAAPHAGGEREGLGEIALAPGAQTIRGVLGLDGGRQGGGRSPDFSRDAPGSRSVTGGVASSGRGGGGREAQGDDAPPVFDASPDGIREAMGFLRYDFRECYEAWLKAQPELGGTVKVRFAIVGEGRGGRVDEVELVESQLRHTLLEGCIISALRGLVFTAPAGGRLAVTYPVAFANDAPAR